MALWNFLKVPSASSSAASIPFCISLDRLLLAELAFSQSKHNSNSRWRTFHHASAIALPLSMTRRLSLSLSRSPSTSELSNNGPETPSLGQLSAAFLAFPLRPSKALSNKCYGTCGILAAVSTLLFLHATDSIRSC